MIYVQETCAWYDTLVARQNDYHPQEPQQTEGLGMQQRAAEQLATHPICPLMDLLTTKESLENLKIELPDWDHLQHVHILLREYQGIPCKGLYSLVIHFTR
jgi:hypothetical protein